MLQPEVLLPVGLGEGTELEALALRDPTTPPTTAPTMMSGTRKAARMTTLHISLSFNAILEAYNNIRLRLRLLLRVTESYGFSLYKMRH